MELQEVSLQYLLDIESRRLALPLLCPLDQPDMLQLVQHTQRFVMAALECSLDLFDGVIDKQPSLSVVPTMLDGKACPVKHEGI